MSEQRPEWIAKRAACQIDTVFEALLDVVQQDVAAMNELPAEQRRRPFKYKYDRRYNEQAIVFRTDEFGAILPTNFGSNVAMAVIFEKFGGGDLIQIRQNLAQGTMKQDVTLDWNEKELSCGLIWDEDKTHPLEVWQVSRKALEPLFFGGADDADPAAS